MNFGLVTIWNSDPCARSFLQLKNLPARTVVIGPNFTYDRYKKMAKNRSVVGCAACLYFEQRHSVGVNTFKFNEEFLHSDFWYSRLVMSV